jgi:hypothetical protein
MMDSATGFNIDPPSPWNPREAMRAVGDVATAHPREPRVNVTIPQRKMSRLPNRSDSDPANIKKPAIVTV